MLFDLHRRARVGHPGKRMTKTLLREELAEREILVHQAFLAAIPGWVRDRIVCGTLTQLPTFLNLDGFGKMAEPYESNFRRLVDEVDRKLTAKYQTLRGA
jgi:hypothetical protein